MFKIFRTSSKKGDKKKKAKTNKNQSINDLNEEVNSKPDGESAETPNSESNKTLERKDSIPIGIKWVTQPSPHVLQEQGNSYNSNNDELRENNSTPSSASQLTESRVSQLTENRVSQLTENRVSQLTENSDINVKEKDGICLKSSNTKQDDENQEAENTTQNNNSKLLIPKKSCDGNYSLENINNCINIQASLKDTIITNIDKKQEGNELQHEVPQNILGLLLAKFDKFEENIMVEIDKIKESQEKQEKRLLDIQTRQEEFNNTLNQIISTQFPSTTKECEADEEKLSESKNVYDDSIPSENSKETSSNNLPTIQEVDVNVDQYIKDTPETDPQSPSISSSLQTSTVTSPVTSHTSEQPPAQDSLTSSEPIADRTDVIVSTCNSLSVSLPAPSPAPMLSPCTTLPESQQDEIPILSVNDSSMSKLAHFQSPISSRLTTTPLVPTPFRSSNPPIKHSPPTKPKRLSLQIPMSSSPSQGPSDDPAESPLRRSIEWPEHSPVIHSPFAVHKPNVSLNNIRKVQDRDRRMFITITP